MKAQSNIFDAIVVGSGISGGWAAKELCEKGIRTLMLERGRNLRHVEDYDTTNTPPWKLDNIGRKTENDKVDYYIQSKVYAFNGGTRDLWVKDSEHPYTSAVDGPEYRWIRGYHLGGRSLMWARQCYRWSELDFEANLKDGIAVDWPVRYEEIAPWYTYVERFVGISGRKEGWPQLPDGSFLPPMEMTCVEEHLKSSIESNWKDRFMTIGRSANLTQTHMGRARCQHRNLCYRGCPFGAYFSTQSSTLPAAVATGKLTLKTDSIVESIIYDEENERASGVRVVDAVTGEVTEYFARIIFLNASTLNSTWILLNSANRRFPEGLANSSGLLGKCLMDHTYQAGAQGYFDDFEGKYHFGGRPNGIYIPRFRNIQEKHPDFLRGYGYQGGSSRVGWQRGSSMPGFGSAFIQELTRPGPWMMSLGGFGEVLPYEDNYVTLNHEKLDKHGMPTLTIHCKHRENERLMRDDYKIQAAEMLEASGARDIEIYDNGDHPGFGIHEMGTARMGRDPKTAVLNKWNQSHDIPNLFITDGSFMTSASCVNPSLTYMAFTARAVDYAVRELNRQNL